MAGTEEGVQPNQEGRLEFEVANPDDDETELYRRSDDALAKAGVGWV